MPLYLVAPGERVKRVKGREYPNRYYLVRGEVDGRDVEVSAKTTDERAAQIFKAELEAALLRDRVPRAGEAVTFAAAAEMYEAFKDPPRGDRTRIARLVAVVGARPVTELKLADFVAAANLLYPGRKNETKNRAVIKPGAAIMHYAAENEWCAWLRMKKFEEGPLVTRASDDATMDKLLDAIAAEHAAAETEHKRRLARKKALLIVWLFHHFNRISDPLRLRWEEHIDLAERTYLLFVGKGNVWKTKPLDPVVWEALANEPEKERRGFLFPWRTRSGVYKWLRPLARRLRVKFTPHMARHYGGKQLNRSGVALKTIMGALDHSDPTSSLRYQDADLEIVREAMGKIVRSAGKAPDKRS